MSVPQRDWETSIQPLKITSSYPAWSTTIDVLSCVCRLQLQAIRLPEELLRVLRGQDCLLGHVQVPRLQESRREVIFLQYTRQLEIF
jgi:hypothetical protein